MSQREDGLWDLAILCLLHERPMHPYEIRRVLKERHKEELLALKPGSLYHAIARLERSRLIEAVDTVRQGRRPERTTYQTTLAGEGERVERLRRRIAEPQRESSDFAASLSFLVYLGSEDAAEQLECRAATLEKEAAQLQATRTAALPFAGRINLIEIEYALAMCKAEVGWVRSLIDEIRSGSLTWDIEAILAAIRAATLASKKEEQHV